MTNVRATEQQVREHYELEGFDVRFWRNGRVFIRRLGEDDWGEGRWLSEYRVDEADGRVFLA